jgi:hypothetical protein
VTASDRRSALGSPASSHQQPQAPKAGERLARDGRPPQSAIEIWASPQLREQNPGRPLSLSEALQSGRRSAASKGREPDPEPEIEP